MHALTPFVGGEGHFAHRIGAPLSPPPSAAMFADAIRKMDGTVGWDAVIVCTSNIGQVPPM